MKAAEYLERRDATVESNFLLSVPNIPTHYFLRKLFKIGFCSQVKANTWSLHINNQEDTSLHWLELLGLQNQLVFQG